MDNIIFVWNIHASVEFHRTEKISFKMATNKLSQSHHAPKPHTGCSQAIFNKNRTSTHGAPCGAVRHPCGSCKGPVWGPVGYEKHWRFPCGALATPVRTLHRVHVETCKLFDQNITIQLCQAVRARSLMWRREQHPRKIPTGASLGLTDKKSYGC